MPEPTDDEIETLFEVLREGAEERHLEAGRSAFTWRTVDEELLELSSFELAGVRSETATALEGRLDQSRVEVRAQRADAGSEFTVSVEPPIDGEVEVLGPDGPVDRVPLDDGLAITAAVPHPIVRLRIQSSGRTWLSNWLTP